jgi:hypothetical protein
MYRNLFIAWYCQGVLILTFVTFGILILFIGADRAIGSFGFLGLLGFLPLFPFVIFPKEKYDERDYRYMQRALFSGFCLGFSAMFPVAAVLALSFQFILDLKSIPVQFLWVPPCIGLITAVFSSSTMIIHLYHKGEQTGVLQ